MATSNKAAKKGLFTLGLRAYAVIVGIVGVFTALLAFGYVSVSPTLFGGLWVGLAATGGVIVLGLTLNKDEVIEEDKSQARCQRWEQCMFTGWLLNIYLVATAIWAGVSFGWFIGGQSAAGITIVGYGWAAVAAYGVIVLAGIVATHSEYVVRAFSPARELET